MKDRNVELRVRRLLVGLWISCSCVILGCSSSSGPARYELSGKVTFNGRPVPVGEVSLQPDGAQGNTGPGSIAMIKDGQYKTDPVTGVVGGAYLVRIAGFDGVPVGDSSEGTALFPMFQTKIELPAQASTYDFEIPAAPGAAR